MNREIKFRAWDTLQGGKFEYWDSETNEYFGIFWTMIKDKSFKGVQQFTGIKDKNGKEIFDGDIIIGNPQSDVITERIFIIGWMNSCWCLIHTESKEVLCSISAYYIEAVEKWATVIGNIYENLELIKQDE
jgi:uncharacterized phage protein (TIGR01671 family)